MNPLSIFISFSSKEKDSMLKINECIESLGYTTYYAPRDIPFGTAYPVAIIDLINKSDVFLLIFSESSQNSVWVQKELERAISKNKFVIPLRIQNVALNSYMEFLISNTQWIDAHDQLFEASAEKFGKYLDSLSKKFGKESVKKQTTPKEEPSPVIDNNTDEAAEKYYHQGKQMIDDKNYSEAYIYLLQAANHDHADAQQNLGLMYQEGFGVNQNYAVALKWYKKSAELGNARALKQIGKMHSLGLGTEVDYEQAFYYFTKAAMMNDLHAMNNLGYMYDVGEGVKQDYAKAMEWYQKAADQNNGISFNNIGNMYENGRGVELDMEKAMAYYLKAADLNEPVAFNNLGNLYYEGNGVKKNYEKAFEWYLKAAEQKYVSSYNSLGYLHYFGYGVDKDYEKALVWYLKGAEKDDVDCQVKAGYMYSKGYGVDANHDLSFDWYERAANNGGANTVAELAVLDYSFLIRKKLENGADTNLLLSWIAKLESLLDKSSIIDIENFREYSEYANFYKLKMEVYIKQNNSFQAVKVYDELIEKFASIYKRYEFDIYLGFSLWSAANILGTYLLSVKQYGKAKTLLELASHQGVKESTDQLAEMYEAGLGVEKDTEKATELRDKAKSQKMKKFTIPCDYGGESKPTELYVRSVPKEYPYLGVEDQAIWLEKAKGGTISKEVRESFLKIHNIAIEHDVSFPELCMETLGTKEE